MTPRDEGILRLWNTKNFSAEEVGSEFGVTRNAVLGVVFRARQAGDKRAKIRCAAHAVRKRTPVRVVFDCGLDAVALSVFAEAATKRGLNPRRLLNKMLLIVARDDMVDAILDDGRL